jgi:hypothetical protein
VREAGLEPARPKTQVPKTCVSAISPLPLKSAYVTLRAYLVESSGNFVRALSSRYWARLEVSSA